MIVARYGASAVIAALITFGLFFVMQLLISTGEKAIQDNVVGHRVEIGQVLREQEVRTRERKPEKPQEPEAPPEAPEIPKVDTSKPNAEAINMNFAGGFQPTVGGGVGIGAPTDGDYLPIVRVQPMYPRRAAERGIQGWVVVELTVTAAGTTEDIRVIEADPPGMFDSAAIKAAEKFKYKPRMVDGVGIPVSGVLYKFTFELEE